MKIVLIRADANNRIGYGHLMRSIALGQVLRREGIEVRFCTATSEVSLCAYLKSQPFDVQFLALAEKNLGSEQDLALMRKQITPSFDWVILDNEYFTKSYQTLIRQGGLHLLVLDDQNKRDFDVDLLVNHSPQAETLNYANTGVRRCLLGLKYALVRQELIKFSKSRNKNPQHILVTLGGSLQGATYEKILEGLSQIKKYRLQIRILPGSSERSALKRSIAKIKLHEVDLCAASLNTASAYDWAGLAVCAGGGTCFELCLFKVTGIIGALADPQRTVAEALERWGAFISIGSYQEISSDSIAETFEKLLENPQRQTLMRQKASDLVDGHGPERISQTMQQIQREFQNA